jgi:O-antigen/teichoic acid export membrane protein
MAEAAAVRLFPRVSPVGLRRGAGLAMSRGLAVGAQMGVQIAVGFVSGPAGIGLLQLHMAWSSLAGELVGGGEPTRALRDTSIRYERGEGQAIRRSLQRALLRILGFGAALALAVGLAVTISSGLADAVAPPSLLVLTVLVSAPLFAMGRVFAESLKGLADPLAAVTLENLVLPVAILLACAAMVAGLLPTGGTALLLTATLGVAVTVLLLGQRLRQRMATAFAGPVFRADDSPQAATEEPGPGGRREQTFLWLNGLLNIAFLQLPFLLLPWCVDAAEIGRFAVAHKLVNVITTLLILLAAVYGPRFARAAAARDTAELERLLRQTQQISLTLFAPTWMLLLLTA